MRTSRTSAYQEMMINSKFLEVPRGSYQRELNIHRVRKIAAAFDPRLLNPPKVSYRSGRYYVFDGQHTIAVLKLLNGGKDLMVRRVHRHDRERRSPALCPADRRICQADTRR